MVRSTESYQIRVAVIAGLRVTVIAGVAVALTHWRIFPLLLRCASSVWSAAAPRCPLPVEDAPPMPAAPPVLLGPDWVAWTCLPVWLHENSCLLIEWREHVLFPYNFLFFEVATWELRAKICLAGPALYSSLAVRGTKNWRGWGQLGVSKSSSSLFLHPQ